LTSLEDNSRVVHYPFPIPKASSMFFNMNLNALSCKFLWPWVLKEGHISTTCLGLHIVHPIVLRYAIKIVGLSSPNIDMQFLSLFPAIHTSSQQFPCGNYWNFDFRCAGGYKLLNLLLEHVVLFFVMSPPCYVEGLMLFFYIHILQPTRASHIGFWNFNHGCCYNNTCKVRK